MPLRLPACAALRKSRRAAPGSCSESNLYRVVDRPKRIDVIDILHAARAIARSFFPEPKNEDSPFQVQ